MSVTNGIWLGRRGRYLKRSQRLRRRPIEGLANRIMDSCEQSSVAAPPAPHGFVADRNSPLGQLVCQDRRQCKSPRHNNEWDISAIPPRQRCGNVRQCRRAGPDQQHDHRRFGEPRPADRAARRGDLSRRHRDRHPDQRRNRVRSVRTSSRSQRAGTGSRDGPARSGYSNRWPTEPTCGRAESANQEFTLLWYR